MKFLRIVGARPQFMQVKPLHEELTSRGHEEIILHTGQHYDDKMSNQFFIDLDLHNADINLNIGSGNHGSQTGKMLIEIERHLEANKYDAVIVDGDTNSTLAGALCAAKLHIPVIHIEAGMRSFNKKMPEEINRILTDHLSSILFCPSEVSKNNLSNEGFTDGVYVVGDVLAECFNLYKDKAMDLCEVILKKFNIKKDKFFLLTMHRAENINDNKRLYFYLNYISKLQYPIIWPLHPHTKKKLYEYGFDEIINKNPFILIEPVGYLDMLALEYLSNMILTDSGGVQREAYHWRKPCIILRDTTEWVEIVQNGWGQLLTPDTALVDIWKDRKPVDENEYDIYKSFGVSKRIVDILEDCIG